MGLGTLIFGARESVFIGVLKVNVLESEEITLSSESTDLEIELGYSITDHIIINPTRIKATFYVSDYSLYGGGSIISSASAAYAVLKFQHNLGLPISYISGLDIYPICHLENVSVPRNNTTGRGLTFDVTLKQIRIVPPLGILFPDSILGGSTSTVTQVASSVAL